MKEEAGHTASRCTDGRLGAAAGCSWEAAWGARFERGAAEQRVVWWEGRGGGPMRARPLLGMLARLGGPTACPT